MRPLLFWLSQYSEMLKYLSNADTDPKNPIYYVQGCVFPINHSVKYFKTQIWNDFFTFCILSDYSTNEIHDLINQIHESHIVKLFELYKFGIRIQNVEPYIQILQENKKVQSTYNFMFNRNIKSFMSNFAICSNDSFDIQQRTEVYEILVKKIKYHLVNY